MGWPQWIAIIYLVIGIIVRASRDFDASFRGFVLEAARAAIIAAVLYWGGFFAG